MSRMRFEDFAVGQTFAASIIITRADFESYVSFARTKNILLENSQLAEKEGIRGVMLSGRFIIARRRRNDPPSSIFRLQAHALAT